MILKINTAIETRSGAGPNGWLLPIWNAAEDGWRPEQVYLTVVAPGAQKGPHLHRKRCGRFVCIAGNALIVQRVMTHVGIAYVSLWTGATHDFAMVEIPPGVPAAIYNPGALPAYVLNLPSPPWRPDDQDEWPVEGWSYDLCPAG